MENQTETISRVFLNMAELKDQNRILMRELEYFRRRCCELETMNNALLLKTQGAETEKKREIEGLQHQHSEAMTAQQMEQNKEMNEYREQCEKILETRTLEVACMQEQLKQKETVLSEKMEENKKLKDEISGQRQSITNLCDENIKWKTEVSRLRMEKEMDLRELHGKEMNEFREQCEKILRMRTLELACTQEQLKQKETVLSEKMEEKRKLEAVISILRHSSLDLCKENLQLKGAVACLKQESEAAIKEREEKVIEELQEQYEEVLRLKRHELACKRVELRKKEILLSKEMTNKRKLEERNSILRQSISKLCKENLQLKDAVTCLRDESETEMRERDGKK